MMYWFGSEMSGWGYALSPAIGALAMSGSSVIVALNAVALRRLRVPGGQATATEHTPGW